MSRLWDTPEFWARQEADEMLRDYPSESPAALARSFERTMRSYDGGIDHGRRILEELKRRADAGVRFWTGPTEVQAELALSVATTPTDRRCDVANDDIPW